MANPDGRTRVIIENVEPEIDCGQFPIKRVPGESVTVEADIFADGHDAVSAVLLHKEMDETDWQQTPMEFIVNDRWWGTFRVRSVGHACYTIRAWVDHYKTWSLDFEKRLEADQDVSVDRIIGAQLIEDAIQHAPEPEAGALRTFAERLRDLDHDINEIWNGDDPSPAHVSMLMFQYAERTFATTYMPPSPPAPLRSFASSGQALGEGSTDGLGISVDRERARFSTWYELFPRSMSPVEGQHGTLKDVENFVPRIASMGFDVLYLPPIHPIGRTFRKGKNNSIVAAEGDVGSPWAIGSEEGGHKSIHPELGTVEDFKSLVATAQEHAMDVALDIAFQCSPDHPYVKEHPEWFKHRPDGTIQYAENPPKKYQDIYPFDFESDAWESLWHELESVIRYWIDLGVRIFRVDNPHTKSFHFWEWTISRLKSEYPDLILLSEAFTRPKVMNYLAKLGFNQSYTYFTWRNTRWELTEYMTELTQTEVREFFRPNFWPNTPDILTEYMQFGGRSAFMSRLVLAATLTSNYGMYGPAYELHENEPVEAGREEYLNSEKYEIRQRDLDQPKSLRDFITTVNRVRQQNRALQSNDSLLFHNIDNDQLIAYSKHTAILDNILLTVVNLDPQHVQSGWLDVPLEIFGIEDHQPYLVDDLLSHQQFLWHGSRNYVELDPHNSPAHIFRVRRRMRSEQDFEYYM